MDLPPTTVFCVKKATIVWAVVLSVVYKYIVHKEIYDFYIYILITNLLQMRHNEVQVYVQCVKELTVTQVS